MTTPRRLQPRDDAGSTLVEQVVIMLLLSGLAVLVTTVIIDLARTTEQHRQRVASLTDQQTALEILTRDLRAADPLVSFTALPCEAGRQPATTPALSSCADTVLIELMRRGARRRITYDLTGATLTRAEQQWNGSAWSAATQRVLARDLSNPTPPRSPLFAFADAAGQPVATAPDVSRINVLLVARNPRSANRSPVSAEVTLRNRISRSSE